MRNLPHRGAEVVRPGCAPADNLVWVELLTQMPRPTTEAGAPQPVQARLCVDTIDDILSLYGDSDADGVVELVDRAGLHWGLPGERILARRYTRGKYEPVASGAPTHYAITQERIASGQAGDVTVWIRGRETHAEAYCDPDTLDLVDLSKQRVKSGVLLQIQPAFIANNYLPAHAIPASGDMYFRWAILPVPASKLE